MNIYKYTYSIIGLLLFLAVLYSCSNESDGKNGLKTIYFPGTNNVCQTIDYKDGKRNGWLKEYYKNGNLKVRQYFLNDTLNDSSICHYENGKIFSIHIFKNGMKEGCWKKFSKEGNLYSEIYFKDDELDGTSITYTYRSGRILKRLNYRNGVKHGKQEHFHNNGKPKSISYYYKGEPCLGTEEWNDYGKKLNHDFKFFVEEQNKVLMENTLRFLIRLEHPQPDDKVYHVANNDTGRVITTLYQLSRIKDYYLLEFPVYKGGFVMEKVKIAALRKTKMDNFVIETTLFNASANNY